MRIDTYLIKGFLLVGTAILLKRNKKGGVYLWIHLFIFWCLFLRKFVYIFLKIVLNGRISFVMSLVISESCFRQ